MARSKMRIERGLKREEGGRIVAELARGAGEEEVLREMAGVEAR